jgi:hypothetical protein
MMSRSRVSTFQPAGFGAALARRPGRPLALHGAVALSTVLLLLLPSPAGAARAAAGVYFAIVLVPAVQVLLWIFAGWRASLALGVSVALLTGYQTVAPPRALVSQPTQWRVTFGGPDEALRSRLNPPPVSRAAALLSAGGSATVNVCLHRGAADDLQISLGGAALTEIKARPGQWSCWLQLAVRPDQIPAPPAPLEIVVRPAGGRWAAGGQPAILTGGYTRPATAGGQTGGAQFFDGGAWTGADLSPSDPDAQTGRYFVELRVADAGGVVREVWY